MVAGEPSWGHNFLPPKCSEGALGFEGLDFVELESKEVPQKPGANSPSEASQKG